MSIVVPAPRHLVMYDGIRGGGSYWLALFFVACVGLGQFIVLNLFLAVLLGNIDTHVSARQHTDLHQGELEISAIHSLDCEAAHKTKATHMPLSHFHHYVSVKSPVRRTSTSASWIPGRGRRPGIAGKELWRCFLKLQLNGDSTHSCFSTHVAKAQCTSFAYDCGFA